MYVRVCAWVCVNYTVHERMREQTSCCYCLLRLLHFRFLGRFLFRRSSLWRSLWLWRWLGYWLLSRSRSSSGLWSLLHSFRFGRFFARSRRWWWRRRLWSWGFSCWCWCCWRFSWFSLCRLANRLVLRLCLFGGLGLIWRIGIHRNAQHEFMYNK